MPTKDAETVTNERISIQLLVLPGQADEWCHSVPSSVPCSAGCLAVAGNNFIRGVHDGTWATG